VRQLAERSRKLEKEVAGLKSKLASGQGGDLSSAAVDVAGVKVVATRVDGADAPALRDAVDRLKSKLRSAAIVLASVLEPDKVVLIAGVTEDQISKVKAGDLVNVVARRRAPRHGASRRQRSCQARRGACSGRTLGRGQARRSFDLSRTSQLRVRGANSDAPGVALRPPSLHNETYDGACRTWPWLCIPLHWKNGYAEIRNRRGIAKVRTYAENFYPRL
jgi:hypothetical protein